MNRVYSREEIIDPCPKARKILSYMCFGGIALFAGSMLIGTLLETYLSISAGFLAIPSALGVVLSLISGFGYIALPPRRRNIYNTTVIGS